MNDVLDLYTIRDEDCIIHMYSLIFLKKKTRCHLFSNPKSVRSGWHGFCKFQESGILKKILFCTIDIHIWSSPTTDIFLVVKANNLTRENCHAFRSKNNCSVRLEWLNKKNIIYIHMGSLISISICVYL